MAAFEKIAQKNGTVLVPLYSFEEGEESFEKLHAALLKIIEPDDAGYSVDSLCIGGYLKKDGILLKTSSTCPYDCCCLVYQPNELTKDQTQMLEGWIAQLTSDHKNP